MPIVSGLAIGALIGAGVGGASAALQNKDIGKGALYGGLTGAVTGGIGGAMGGAGAAAGEGLLASGAEGALTGGEAATFMGSTALPTSMAPAAEYGIPSLVDGASSMPLNQSAQLYADTPMSGNIASGFNSFTSDPMKYFGDNKISMGLAGLAGGMAPSANQQKESDMGTIRPYTYTAGLNPSYTGAGTPYFNQKYTAGTPYAAAEGGIMNLASGGSAVADYNKMLMDRAQEEYVNSPQLGAFRSHFNDPIANADSTNALYQQYLGRPADPTGIAANQRATPEEITRSIQSSPEYLNANPGATAPAAPTGPISFDPVTRRYITGPAPAAAPSGIAALPQQNVDQGGGGGGDGEANGGLMRSYAMGGGIGAGYTGFDEQNNAINSAAQFNQGPQYPMQQPQNFNMGGGIYNLGGYSDGGRLLKGPGDGVSDDIPAQIGAKQPARLADGEFVVPARIVSELGNGSTDAGAKRLYAMMDRVQANRKKTVGKGKVAVNSKSAKYLPA
jgi:hypothetical protein